MDNNIELERKDFYHFTLELLNQNQIPYLIGGAYALRVLTGIYRDTKDIDIFCRYQDHEKILKLFADRNYQYEITDIRWLVKIFHEKDYVDIIFSNPSNICPVDDSWFENAVAGKLFDVPVLYMAAEEMIWSKIFVQDGERYDASDINHIILKQGNKIDWNRLVIRMSAHWQLLLAQLLSYQYVYPSLRDVVPKWLMLELAKKVHDQYDFTPTLDKICRGPYLDNQQYEVDIKEWGFKAITSKTV